MTDEVHQPTEKPLKAHAQAPAQNLGPSQDAERWMMDLLQVHYANLYRLAFTMLSDTEQVRRVVIETFAAFSEHTHHHPRRPDPLWMYEYLLSHIRIRSKLPEPPASPSELDARIWLLVDKLEPKERQLCILSYVLGFPDHDAAQVLKVSQEAVKAQREIFQHRFQEELKDLPESRPPSGTLEEVDQAARLAALVASSLQARWPAPDLSQDELSRILQNIRETIRPARPPTSQRIQIPGYLWAVGGLLAVMLGLGIVYLIWQIGAAPKDLPQASPVSTTGSVTPRPSPRQVNPLTMFSSSSTIIKRMQESMQLWNTLWVDMQVAEFGPPGYYGSPRLYRLQSWISQPAQSIQTFGLLAEKPSSVYLFQGWRSYYLNPVLGVASSQESAAKPESLIKNQRLREMIFPQTSRWVTDPGAFQNVRTDTLAGRRALVVDWKNSYGQRQARLWLDVVTGMILRQQEYGGDSFDLLLADSSFTEVVLDQNFPPARLASQVQEVGSIASETGNGESDPPQIILPTPTAAVPLGKRAAPAGAPAPQGYDPSHSLLAFEFANDLTVSNAVSGTADQQVDLLADGYRIGASKFGLPWMLRCDRSPDGLRLAYNTASDGAAKPDDSLRWFDLRQPDRIYQPLPDLHALDFSFSGSGTRLAVFALGAGSEQSGLYLVDIGTGSSRMILPLAEASSLVWSPDEEFLALTGIEQPGDEAEVMVIHVRTGQIAFRADRQLLGKAIPADWPLANWGVDFPIPPGGLENCSKPPPG